MKENTVNDNMRLSKETLQQIRGQLKPPLTIYSEDDNAFTKVMKSIREAARKEEIERNKKLRAIAKEYATHNPISYYDALWMISNDYYNLCLNGEIEAMQMTIDKYT